MKQALGILIIFGGLFIVYSALTNKPWIQSLTNGTLVSGSTSTTSTSSPTAPPGGWPGVGVKDINNPGHGYAP